MVKQKYSTSGYCQWKFCRPSRAGPNILSPIRRASHNVRQEKHFERKFGVIRSIGPERKTTPAGLSKNPKARSAGRPMDSTSLEVR
jgi:hypothetical protein